MSSVWLINREKKNGFERFWTGGIYGGGYGRTKRRNWFDTFTVDCMRAGVENSWGGRESQAIAERTVSRVFDYFVQLEDPLDIYNGVAFHEVGAILMAGLDKLHIDAEDGSVEEVTDKLLDLYEDCRDGFLKIIEELRSKSQTRAIVFKIPNGNDDEDEDEDTFMNDDQTTDMMVDGSEHYSNRKAEAMTVDEPADDDGWTVFSRRKNKGTGI